MKAGIAVAIGSVLALACGSVHAAANGNALITECAEVIRNMDGMQAKNLYAAGSCLGLVSGVADTLMEVNGSLPRSEQMCAPQDGIEYGQVVRIVVKYLNDHPAELHQNASVLAGNALRDAYPCKNKRAGFSGGICPPVAILQLDGRLACDWGKNNRDTPDTC